ncbi:dynein heavy chain 1, axonemal, partial [Sigmodon hispidus]
MSPGPQCISDRSFASTPAGLVSIPKYPFREQKEDFTFVSLLTRPEVITALSKVRTECNKVTSMSLFHSSLSKYSRLEEFEQIQSQTFSQVPGNQIMEGGPQAQKCNSTGLKALLAWEKGE